MRILSLKPGHDGAIAYIDDGRLVFSLEAEKDSFPRHGDVSAGLVVRALEMAPEPPDVLAIGGWEKCLPGFYTDIAAGYFGSDAVTVRESRMFGRRVQVFSSSHERSHVYMAAAMAPAAPLEECVILVWEGIIGSFYHWRMPKRIVSTVPVMSQPGARYAALFALADTTFPLEGSNPKREFAGKLMALSAYAKEGELIAEDRAVVEDLLTTATVYPFDKFRYRQSRLYNCGVDTPPVHATAKYLGDRIFETFQIAAKHSMPPGFPLLISGGCGLNCDWNTRWRQSSLFSDVFVPPCANDSGSAIGTAADALTFFGQPCRLTWSVYSGDAFVRDWEPDPAVWQKRSRDFAAIARTLARGEAVAWVEGRSEIGPRALGHRSLLASPLHSESARHLNVIKQREGYRPIAPACLREELSKWFDPPIDDPYMLYFTRVRTTALPGVTHVDGSARIQSIRREDGLSLYSLLECFRRESGLGVLCNTSLNFKGRGFINRASELFAFCEARGVNEVVMEHDWYQRR
jgi:hydroxymethyl cephem carbamoyltransferase